ncbi:MAG: hypothetical protein R3272_06265 [Candidatus Promineifilaceae bacterium]|nr:hypothetical protein [Candidatus Promineifilaceae bacterium]
MERQPGWVVLVAFIVGFVIGLVVFGWWLTPLEYTGAAPGDLLEGYQDAYILGMARLHEVEGNPAFVQDAFSGWETARTEVCELAAARAGDPAASARLISLATALDPQGCDALPVADAEEEGGFGSLLLVLLLIVLFMILVGAILYLMRRSRPAEAVEETYLTEMETVGPATLEESDAEIIATPIARFETTYVRGHDTYDDSFSIENEQGDFLGECGVGISESIGVDEPKNVTAFEVWLFDKNDIRTVTKVIMSDHAFFDDALKAKLAPKGEPVLAREGETIVLETATLIINAEITEMEYGSGALPPKSFFERFTVELSAWAKEGDFEEPDIQGHIDEMLDY